MALTQWRNSTLLLAEGGRCWVPLGLHRQDPNNYNDLTFPGLLRGPGSMSECLVPLRVPGLVPAP